MADVFAGQPLTAGLVQSLTPQTPQPWTPEWTTTTGLDVSFGDSGVTGTYQWFGRLCVGRLDVNFGSTANFGTSPTTNDNWRFSLPVAAADVYGDVGRGELWADSVSNGARAGCRVRLDTTTTFLLETSAGRVDSVDIANRGSVDSVSPWTWKSGDNFSFTFSYPTATAA